MHLNLKRNLLIVLIFSTIFSALALAGNTIIQNGNVVTDIFNTTSLLVEEISGHKVTGQLLMEGNRITGASDPENPSDCATKKYVDEKAEECGVDANIPPCPFNGTPGDIWVKPKSPKSWHYTPVGVASVPIPWSCACKIGTNCEKYYYYMVSHGWPTSVPADSGCEEGPLGRGCASYTTFWGVKTSGSGEAKVNWKMVYHTTGPCGPYDYPGEFCVVK